eukprot:TRINITY_DN102986_c0_g1_i1.p1 TRINITY_DN102986_c0_g1~~TRINITY_DN102986_c0_g1_i1.p1  ORF type:complete len:398 (+),score=35.43 TRINITY_DN102986_c0_g1_i1:1-1194(+)
MLAALLAQQQQDLKSNDLKFQAYKQGRGRPRPSSSVGSVRSSSGSVDSSLFDALCNSHHSLIEPSVETSLLKTYSTVPLCLGDIVGTYTKQTGDAVELWVSSETEVQVVGLRGTKSFGLKGQSAHSGDFTLYSLEGDDSTGKICGKSGPRGEFVIVSWSSGFTWRKKKRSWKLGTCEQRDLAAIPIQPGQPEGRATIIKGEDLTGIDQERMGISEALVAAQLDDPTALQAGWRGKKPNCYHPVQQQRWRGQAGFVYYPPTGAFKVYLPVTPPDHTTHRNVYHGTTLDRLPSILKDGLQLSGVGAAKAQNPYQTRHVGRIFTSPQFSTALGFAHVCEWEGREVKVVLKCLQDPVEMVPLENPAACGFQVDGDYFYTVTPSSLCIFAVCVHFGPFEKKK